LAKKIILQISILISFVLFFNIHLFASEKENLIKIQKAITEKGSNWTAGTNWVTKLSREEQRRLCGTILEKPDPSEVTLLSLPQIDDLPAEFDWRDNNGNWVTPVTDQGQCGSCAIFSGVAQAESWWKIYNSNLDSMIDLSEQFILSCGNVVTCEGGGTLENVLDYIKTTGVPTESCFNYLADDTVPCTNACANWQDEAIKIPGWGYITLDEPIVDNIKNAVYRHPVSAGFIAYEDFQYYSGGVYEHVWGNDPAGHGILIVGWNDEEQSWICKNSWSPAWGENGYFRIKWGNCEIGNYSPFIWDEMIDERALDIPNNRLDLSLTIGDSVVEYVTIDNIGSKVVEYSSIDYGFPCKFHSDSYNSWDGLSWWCGDPDSGGYDNHWLQYLETPAINLSNTTSPKLSFMINWSLEDPAGTDPPWDGWDGCNVWVSTDSGNTFNVAEPITPAYTCQSLWSFGDSEQGWNFGEGIAGWAGLSDGWKQAEFDLTTYISDKVIIRFALASDLAYCTTDNSTLLGLLVDEIRVTEEYSILFKNNGEDNGDMKRDGFGELIPADWLSVFNSGGAIPANSSTDLGIVINTRILTPANYGGKVIIISNDTTQVFAEISLCMSIVAPQHDLAIENVWLPSENIPILFPIEPGAKIRNAGQNNETDFDVVLTVNNEAQVIYRDTAHVDLLNSCDSIVVKFNSLMLTEPGNLDFNIFLINLVDDYNDYNNSYLSKTVVSNLVDGFETDTGLWSFQGGWGITNKLQGNTGDYAAHVSGGTLPYPNNMNAYMTFLPGFDLKAIDKLTLRFWTKYVTEENKDICYVEVSGDKINWTTLYSLSGMSFAAWTQHEVGLTDFITSGFEKVWVRFHFVSDEANAYVGVGIDDIEVYTLNPTDVKEQVTAALVPAKWELAQNYPNPFNLNTNFSYSMVEPGNVKLTIYNINGKVVINLSNQYQAAGNHEISWDGRDNTGKIVGSGVYLYQLEVKDKYFNTKKMILLK